MLLEGEQSSGTGTEQSVIMRRSPSVWQRTISAGSFCVLVGTRQEKDQKAVRTKMTEEKRVFCRYIDAENSET